MEYKLHFRLRTDKINRDGEHPLCLFYIHNRELLKIKTGFSIKKYDWDGSFPKSYLRNFKTIILSMDELEKNIKRYIEDYFDRNDRYPYTDELRSIIESNGIPKDKSPKEVQKDNSIQKLFKEFIQLGEKGDKRKSTIVVYKSTLLHWIEFEKDEKRTFSISDVSFKLLEDFSMYLKNTGKMFSTTGKYLKTMKTFLNYFVKTYKNIPIDGSYREIKIEREVENKFQVLDEFEYEQLRKSVTYSEYIINKEKIILNARERLIGKMFLFMCSTGMSYSDLLNLTFLDIKVHTEKLIKKKSNSFESEFAFIRYDRIKMNIKTDCVVPLFRHTIEIILGQLDPDNFDILTEQNHQLPDRYLKGQLKQSLKPYQFSNEPINLSESRVFKNIPSSKFNVELHKLCEKIQFNESIKITPKRKNADVEIKKKYELITSHTGRRTYITYCLKKGVRPDVLMRTTGHSKMDTMKRYNLYSPQSINEEFEKKLIFEGTNP